MTGPKESLAAHARDSDAGKMRVRLSRARPFAPNGRHRANIFILAAIPDSVVEGDSASERRFGLRSLADAPSPTPSQALAGRNSTLLVVSDHLLFSFSPTLLRAPPTLLSPCKLLCLPACPVSYGGVFALHTVRPTSASPLCTIATGDVALGPTSTWPSRAAGGVCPFAETLYCVSHVLLCRRM